MNKAQPFMFVKISKKKNYGIMNISKEMFHTITL